MGSMAPEIILHINTHIKKYTTIFCNAGRGQGRIVRISHTCLQNIFSLKDGDP